MLRALGLLAAVLVLGAGAALLWRQLDAEMERPAPAATTVRIVVPAGAGLRTVLMQLQRAGAVRDARLIDWDLRLHRRRPRIQAGTYDIPPHASARALIEQLVEGRVVLESLTVVEGWTLAQMRQALDGDSLIEHALRGRPDGELMAALGHSGLAAEGRFFPDTYRFAAGTSDRRILEMAYDRMQAALEQAWAGRANELPLAGPEQALILASIIEKETGREEERPLVAAVFVNRLRLGMRLQSDPTVIYGLGSRYDGSLHTRDLATDTPYNSYTRAGLPPTPIALPGAASLHAAMHPAASNVLYFVATGNGDGSHHFSATLAEHDVALRAYLRHLGVQVGAPPSSERRP
jgi:UPF0755 protein